MGEGKKKKAKPGREKIHALQEIECIISNINDTVRLDRPMLFILRQ